LEGNLTTEHITIQARGKELPVERTIGSKSTEVSLRHRVLFISRSALEHASGTPVILDELLCQFPAGMAELLCESRMHETRTRAILARHRIYNFTFQNALWPFRKGSRVRFTIAWLGFPWILAVGLWRVFRFRPQCIIAIYYDARWILAAYAISRLSFVPLVFYVHDAFRENVGTRLSLRAMWREGIERLTLKSARVLVLHASLAERYHRKYGITCAVLRRIVTQRSVSCLHRQNKPGEFVIGLAGAIYDNNSRQVRELTEIVKKEPRLRLRIFTGSVQSHLNDLGIGGERVSVRFEKDYDRLLAHLSECDLLYLPLAFVETEGLSSDALQYAFPTKSIDYLLVGSPILVHCPERFELFQFFQRNRCAYLLGNGDQEKLHSWLKDWIEGKEPKLDDECRLRALKLFSAEHNREVLSGMLHEIANRKNP
jgi:hypothetical protein